MIEAAANLNAKPTDEGLSRLLEKLGSVDRLEHEVQLLREQVEKQNDTEDATRMPPGANPEYGPEQIQRSEQADYDVTQWNVTFTPRDALRLMSWPVCGVSTYVAPTKETSDG
jgi:hypothetical protein